MSAGGPESIPTSADRRSKRPVKKRALTPVSAQAATVDALFAKPDQEIRIPVSITTTTTESGSALVARRAAGGAPPEIISNVQGSSSGAGSGEFHVYKASRRREYARLRQLDEEARRDREKTEFELTRSEREARDDDKTKRNREKREKAKARKAKAKKGDAKGGEPKGAETKGTAAKPVDAPNAAISKPAETNESESKPEAVPAVPSVPAVPAVPVPVPAVVAAPASFDGPGLLIQDDDD